MPKPVCVPCAREMELVAIGAVVQFNALSAAGGAYQQWRSDSARCPGCGATVVFRYAERAHWEHHHKTPPLAKPYVIVEERLFGKPIRLFGKPMRP